ncbi:Plasmodium exported protein, unknown function [Plasmodium vivax]|uniref:Pv-fam-d protein n=1 Tax=Plasmodium vivax TaxID=5855 RepID=A0A564ZWL8_PLAVI|nr:Plasmodium exported protein, unknown function [Plasmodium vivax]
MNNLFCFFTKSFILSLLVWNSCEYANENNFGEARISKISRKNASGVRCMRLLKEEGGAQMDKSYASLKDAMLEVVGDQTGNVAKEVKELLENDGSVKKLEDEVTNDKPQSEPDQAVVTDETTPKQDSPVTEGGKPEENTELPAKEVKYASSKHDSRKSDYYSDNYDDEEDEDYDYNYRDRRRRGDDRDGRRRGDDRDGRRRGDDRDGRRRDDDRDYRRRGDDRDDRRRDDDRDYRRRGDDRDDRRRGDDRDDRRRGDDRDGRRRGDDRDGRRRGDDRDNRKYRDDDGYPEDRDDRDNRDNRKYRGDRRHPQERDNRKKRHDDRYPEDRDDRDNRKYRDDDGYTDDQDDDRYDQGRAGPKKRGDDRKDQGKTGPKQPGDDGNDQGLDSPKKRGGDRYDDDRDSPKKRGGDRYDDDRDSPKKRGGDRYDDDRDDRKHQYDRSGQKNKKYFDDDYSVYEDGDEDYSVYEYEHYGKPSNYKQPGFDNKRDKSPSKYPAKGYPQKSSNDKYGNVNKGGEMYDSMDLEEDGKKFYGKSQTQPQRSKGYDSKKYYDDDDYDDEDDDYDYDDDDDYDDRRHGPSKYDDPYNKKPGQPQFGQQPGQPQFGQQPGQPQFGQQPGQPGQPGRPGQPGQPQFGQQPGRPGQPGQPGQPQVGPQPGKPGQQPGRPGQPQVGPQGKPSPMGPKKNDSGKEESKEKGGFINKIKNFIKKSDAMYETELLNVMMLSANSKNKTGAKLGIKKQILNKVTILSPVLAMSIFFILFAVFNKVPGMIVSAIFVAIACIYVIYKHKKCKRMFKVYGKTNDLQKFLEFGNPQQVSYQPEQPQKK